MLALKVVASNFNPYPARAILGGPCIVGPEGKAAPLTVGGRAPLSTWTEAKARMVSILVCVKCQQQPLQLDITIPYLGLITSASPLTLSP